MARVTERLAARRAHRIDVERLHTRHVERLKETLAVAAQRFNKEVGRAAQEKLAEFRAAVKPFWGHGQMPELDRWLPTVHIPAVEGIRHQCYHSAFAPDPPPDFWSEEATRFVAHASRAAKELNLELNFA